MADAKGTTTVGSAVLDVLIQHGTKEMCKGLLRVLGCPAWRAARGPKARWHDPGVVVSGLLTIMVLLIGGAAVLC